MLSYGLERRDVHISEFVKSRTQAEVAALLGVSQGAVHQMLRAGRDVFFRQLDDGSFEHYEIKKARRKKAA